MENVRIHTSEYILVWKTAYTKEDVIIITVFDGV